VKTRLVKVVVVVKAPDEAMAMAVAAVAVAPKAPVVTEAAVVVDAVASTAHPAHKAHAVPKDMAVEAVEVRAVDVRRWVTRNRAAMKADLAAAWASALPALRQVVNPILCAPVSI
jgi:hypothetical protein